MTSAEFKTLRESLGLSQSWIAEKAAVSLRTVQYWESGRNQVPQDVQELICDVNQTIDKCVKQSLVLVKEKLDKDGIVELFRYKSDEDLFQNGRGFQYPYTTHAVMIFKTKHELERLGYKVIIRFKE